MPSMVCIRRSASYRGALLLGLLMFLATSASADIVILRSGAQMTGTVANREQVATSPESFSVIGVLTVDEAGERKLLQVAVDDISYVLLEDDGGTRVVQFVGRQRIVQESRTSSASRSSEGAALVIIGGAAFALGAIVKFGDEKVTFTDSSIKHDEKSYGAANYALMIGGGSLVTVGILLMSISSGRDRGHGPVLAFDNHTRNPQFGYRVRF